ncbi:MAG: 16S rRNA (guanine(966)-N(2))-methyltransferase RsmD [Pseudomonadota bacterium]
MRIVAGDWRGRRLQSPPGQTTRPTTDRVRESLFNILQHAEWAQSIAGKLTNGTALVLDGFAGSGMLGFEALSRGAERCWFWDKSASAITTVRANIEHLKADDHAIAQRQDATKPPPAPRPVDLIFLDPPYEQGFIPLTLAALVTQGWIHADSLIVAETKRREALVLDAIWQALDRRDIGDTALNFYRWRPEG